jgi:hypothetical protein
MTEERVEYADVVPTPTHHLMRELMRGKHWKIYQWMLEEFNGDIYACIATMEVYFWTTQRNGGWIYKSSNDWQEMMHCTEHAWKTARKILQGYEWWQEKLMGVPATVHFRINLHAFDAQFGVRHQTSSVSGTKPNTVDHTVDQNLLSADADDAHPTPGVQQPALMDEEDAAPGRKGGVLDEEQPNKNDYPKSKKTKKAKKRKPTYAEIEAKDDDYGRSCRVIRMWCGWSLERGDGPLSQVKSSAGTLLSRHKYSPEDIKAFAKLSYKNDDYYELKYRTPKYFTDRMVIHMGAQKERQAPQTEEEAYAMYGIIPND